MNVHYTGRHVELSDAHRKKLESRFQKIHRLLGKRDAPEAHLILSLERSIYHAEVTLNHRHHTMVVECAGPALFSTAQEAVEKLEKQIIRNQDKWREKKRRSRSAPEAEPASPATDGSAARRLFRTATLAAKPLTIEEALIEIEQDDRDCVAYRDADNGHLRVLFRRRDGHLHIVEA